MKIFEFILLSFLSFKEISKAFEAKGMNISPHVVKQLLKNMVL